MKFEPFFTFARFETLPEKLALENIGQGSKPFDNQFFFWNFAKFQTCPKFKKWWKSLQGRNYLERIFNSTCVDVLRSFSCFFRFFPGFPVFSGFPFFPVIPSFPVFSVFSFFSGFSGFPGFFRFFPVFPIFPAFFPVRDWENTRLKKVRDWGTREKWLQALPLGSRTGPKKNPSVTEVLGS